jgi:hypothetical protein
MSGPKVVRVVTKQEIMANCRGRIEAVHDAFDRWHKLASKLNSLTIEDEKRAENRLSSIVKLFEQEQFSEVTKRCADEIAVFQVDINRIQEEAIAKAELERSMRRKLKYSAETLITTFTAANRQIPTELFSIASSVLTVKETDLITMSSILSRILTEYTVSSVEPQTMTSLQKELSKKLTEGEAIQTLADWKVLHEDIKVVESNRRLDKLLAEIDVIENDEIAQPFLQRITLIENESIASRRSLLTDSLLLDLAAHLNERKIQEQVLVSMRETLCELRCLTSKVAKDLEALFTKAIDSKDISVSKALNEKGIELIQKERKTLAGISRREAILKGIADLGYEVKENMATAWAEDGRIVVRKPDEKSYGVELGAVEDAARVQVQLVSFEESIHASQDLDREIVWCSEFSRLKSALEKSGTSLHIEKALPVGSKPVKRTRSATVLDQKNRTSEVNLKKKMFE